MAPSRHLEGLLAIWIMVLMTSLYGVQGFPALPHRIISTRSASLPFTCTSGENMSCHTARRRREADELYSDEDYYERFADGDDEEDSRGWARPESRRLGRRSTRGSLDEDFNTEGEERRDDFGLPSPFGRRAGVRISESVSKALLAGVFVLGIGTGVTVDSAINTNPKDLASRDAVDRNAPNPTLCTSYGASAMAFDQRVFVSFDPFNVYVAQADVKPACVLRPANVVPVLQGRGLLNNKEAAACKANMNTWAFVGDLGDMPQLSCVYQSEDAQNEFLEDPKLGIGEDYLDDDRRQGSFRKFVKDGASKRPAASLDDQKGASEIAKGSRLVGI